MTITDSNGARRRFGGLAVYALFAIAVLLNMPAAGSAGLVTKSHDQLIKLNKCSYGPSYWCKNLTNAAGCSAVEDCIQTVWKTQKYPDDTDNICNICKNMVEEARVPLERNATSEKFQEVIYRSCQLLPLKTVKTECSKLADVFMVAFLDTLASQMDPNVVCTVSGLCNSERIDKLLLEDKQYQRNIKVKKSKGTKMVIIMDNFVLNALQVMSRDEMLEKFLIVRLGMKLKEWCAGYSLKWKTVCTDFIAYLLQTVVPAEEMCGLMNFCKPKTQFDSVGDIETNVISFYDGNDDQKSEKPKVPTPLCLVCTIAMNNLPNEIKDKSNESEIQDLLKSMYLHNVGEMGYQHFIDSNYPTIVNFVKVDTDPGVVCRLMTVCNENNATVKMNKHNQSTELGRSVKCTVCKLFVRVFGNRLRDDTDVINKADMIKLCSEVDVLYKNQADLSQLQQLDFGCRMFEEEGPNNDLMLNHMIMSILPSCHKSCGILPFYPKCRLCKHFIQINDNITQVHITLIIQEFKYWLKPRCKYLVKNNECMDFVEHVTEKYQEKLIDQMSNETACEVMGYCAVNLIN